MANLAVRPSYQVTETDILTADKLNLLGTPIVDLSVETPVNDQNYFRNGNFYSSFWTNPAGVPVPPGAFTPNASYWLAYCGAATASLTFQRSNDTPDLFSLFSAQLVGAATGGVTNAYFGQQISGDLSATLRRVCTFSGYIENKTGIALNPTLVFYTPNQFNNFNSITLQATIDLQTCANGMWTFVTASIDVSTLANAANGLFVLVGMPGGNLSTASQTINFSRLKFQIGEIATEFSDDPSLFIQAPSVDSTMLQDGCIARPGLFLPAVIPQGAFVAGAIQSADIGAGQVAASNLASGAVVGSLGYTPVNKAGDTGVGIINHTVDTVLDPTAPSNSGVVIATTPASGGNSAYFPSIGFVRGPGALVAGRAIGLDIAGRFRTLDSAGTSGYLLDTVTGVDTASYQAGSITLQALAQSLINVIIPPGMIRMFGGPTIPTGWLVCDGSAVDRTLYAALFAAIGTYWGSGDNISTFNLPDLRGRSPLGYVNSPVVGITGRAFASIGGEENHVLSVLELADHGHQLTDATHSHNLTQTPHQHSYINPIGGLGATPGSGQYSAVGTNETQAVNANITVNAASANITIANSGGNNGHNNMSPFSVVYFIVKT